MFTIPLLRRASLDILADIAHWSLIKQAHQLHVALIKAGYRPDQPRVPFGNHEGGQWTGGGGGSAGHTASPTSLPSGGILNVVDDGSVNEGVDDDIDPYDVNPLTGDVYDDAFFADAIDILPKIASPRGPNGEGYNVVNIFIGGADDEGGLFGNHPVLNSDSLHKYVYGDNYYAPHDGIKDIDAQIDKFPKSTTINIIGHSLGGSTGAQAALDRPGRINTLVTVDPVGTIITGFDPKTGVPIRDFPDFDKLNNNVGTWVNVNAIGSPGGSAFNFPSLRS